MSSHMLRDLEKDRQAMIEQVLYAVRFDNVLFYHCNVIVVLISTESRFCKSCQSILCNIPTWICILRLSTYLNLE